MKRLGDIAVCHQAHRAAGIAGRPVLLLALKTKSVFDSRRRQCLSNCQRLRDDQTTSRRAAHKMIDL